MKSTKIQAAEIVAGARSPQKITTEQLLTGLFDDLLVFHGDRVGGEDPAIIGGVATFQGQPVTVIATDKGTTPEERIARHFGCPEPAGYRKALRLMQAAEKFNRPIITLVNTAGAYPGAHAEETGQGMAIANNLYTMSTLKTPIISLIFGEGGSGGALALACGDQVWMVTNSMYSVLSPEGFASILWKDSSLADQAAEIMQLTPTALKKAGIIEGIIPESDNPAEFCQAIQSVLSEQLTNLQAIPSETLLKMRQARFRQF
ncbi:acetyl-CoA carboxylase carboxyltransferase subunit alpha [Latilactobacillus fuchuensis]|uniref:acetyl-CoA carboxytransferase n=1 Tax=Latilactobacillus fuchuensis TaxID=164393 RepID=A0A2N9DWU5_9LACO|nr:carboxyltransferase subunit alpha [Latilactobacillus fuchuensis]SPC39142.1 acetyl-CoA carboxylase, carboxytransferase, alpha subunit [Latilactobacillus fuchuensis]